MSCRALVVAPRGGSDEAGRRRRFAVRDLPSDRSNSCLGSSGRSPTAEPAIDGSVRSPLAALILYCNQDVLLPSNAEFLLDQPCFGIPANSVAVASATVNPSQSSAGRQCSGFKQSVVAADPTHSLRPERTNTSSDSPSAFSTLGSARVPLEVDPLQSTHARATRGSPLRSTGS